VLTAVVEMPARYGRIVRSSPGGPVVRIVEARDATDAEREIHEINAGVYAFSLEGLFEALRGISSNNSQQEFYLTDLIAIYHRRGLKVEGLTVPDQNEIFGINSRAELAAAGRRVRDAKNAAVMESGVTLEDPATTYIDQTVEIGADTVIHPGVTLEGRTRIGAHCELRGGVRIVDSTLADHVVVHDHCVISDSSIEAGARVGPFAHVRNGALVGAEARVGNFVEMKKASLGKGSKAAHLSYLGDAIIGSNVNIGAGTITCNYDGQNKHQTTIESGAFIGSDSQLIAPVTIGRDAYVGTGATIREDVPAGSLAVSAGRQRNIEGWVEQKRKKRGTTIKN
jgi:bifunctional UDP-N-acetylglucosamine pyrophosphorylase/glucosamine-1-phosphate N-acetyltransferase